MVLPAESPDGDEARAIRTECDRLGAAAETAQFRVQLVCGNLELINLADAAFSAVGGGAISDTPGRTELRAAEDRFEAAVKAFISAAAKQLRAISLRPQQQRE